MTVETFGQMLRRLRIERAMSQNALARRAGLDPAYVNRMERAGEQTRSGKLIDGWKPGRPAVMAISEVLEMSYAERDRFLFIAGLAPCEDWQTRAEDAEAALRTVREAVGVLTDAVEPTLLRSRAG